MENIHDLIEEKVDPSLFACMHQWKQDFDKYARGKKKP